MNARTSWSARQDRGSDENGPESAGESAAVPLDDLLEARFDGEGRLAQIGRGGRQRIAERLDPRPPAMNAAELERAVKKLSLGLKAIERHSSAARLPETRAPQPRSMSVSDPALRRDAHGRDFVTYSLDRLEARLDSLSKRLQERATGGSAPDSPRSANVAPDARPPEEAHDKERPELFAGAEAAVSALDRDIWDTDPTFAAEPQGAVVPESRSAPHETIQTSSTLAGEPLASGASRRSEAESSERGAAEVRHTAEAEPHSTAEVKRHFAALEARIEALQQSSDRNHIESVRGELVEILRGIEVLGREGRSVAGALEKAHARLDQVESKLNAARNMTGNRLSELQDRMSGLTERLGDIEAEVPGFDALRENQGAILERFDRIEGLVSRLASPEDLLARVDGLKHQLKAVASHDGIGRVEEQIRKLAERLESLPDAGGFVWVLENIESQLQALAAESAEGGRQRSSSAAKLDAQLSGLAAQLQDVAQSSRPADLSAVERLLSDIATRLEEDRRYSDETLGQLDRRLAAITHAVAKREDDSSTEILSALTRKMDSLADAIGAQDVGGARRDLQVLDRKLDQLSSALSTQADHLSAPQMQPLEERLDRMQRQLEDIAERAQSSAAQFGPFAQMLHEISERISGIGATADGGALAARLGAIEDRLAGVPAKGPEVRGLHTQLEGIVSRLELLKGRSIDPARLAELFDRVDSAIRTGLQQDRLERIEEKLGAGIPAALPDDRFAGLEQKLEEISRQVHSGAGEFLNQDDLADLRADIVALRRELRSLPGLGDGEESLSGVLKAVAQRLERLPEDPPATAVDLERQLERIAQLLDDPGQSRSGLVEIEASLKSIEARLDDTRRALLYRDLDESAGEGAEGDINAVAGLARALSDDVSVLKNATSASDRKTKDALEAVQDTLEAVVKRMAFLERDADLAAEAVALPRSDRAERALAPAMAPVAMDPAPALAAAQPQPQPEPQLAEAAALTSAKPEGCSAASPPAS